MKPPEPEALGDVDAAVTEMVDDTAELTPGPQVRPGRKPPEREEREPPPEPKRYQAMNGGQILHRGAVTNIKPGKVVDECQYNIEQLKAQGIDLQPLN